MTAAVLRIAAIAIAVAAFVDPAIRREVPRPQPITIATMHADDIPHADRLSRALTPAYDVAVRIVENTADAAACPASGGCLLVSRGRVPTRLTAGAKVLGALRIAADHAVIIEDVDVPPRVHRDAVARARIRLSRAVGRVDLFDDRVLVGSSEPGSAREVDVEWVPLGPGARAIRVAADGDAVDVAVHVEAEPFPVLVYETEPTWLGTFVRRALDDDPRFTVHGRTGVAPPVVVAHGDAGSLNPATLDRTRAVVIAAPHRLSAADVALLEAFVSRRGGSLILLPDSRPSGPFSRLTPPVTSEGRHAAVQSAGPLHVREWLVFEPGAGAVALARVGEDAIVVSQPLGRGRIITAGALDAWRYRGETSLFSAFWTTLVWDAIAAAGRPLRVETDDVIAAPGDARRVTAELQSMDDVPLDLSASGTLRCGEDDEFVRLWPAGRPGVFEGRVRPEAAGTCDLTVSVNDFAATTSLLVRDDVRRREHPEALDAAMRAHGAVLVGSEGASELARHAREALPPRREPQTTYPMRSALWLPLFAGCLAGEWWLRRRSGLS